MRPPRFKVILLHLYKVGSALHAVDCHLCFISAITSEKKVKTV